MKCKICQKEIYSNSKIKECKNEGEINSLNKNICLDCYRRIYSTFDKNLSYNKIFYHICKNCNNELLTLSSIYTCNICGFQNRKNLKYNHVCNVCGYHEITNSAVWTCPNCKNKFEKRS